MSQNSTHQVLASDISGTSMMLSQLSMATSPKFDLMKAEAGDRAIIEMCLQRKSDIN